MDAADRLVLESIAKNVDKGARTLEEYLFGQAIAGLCAILPNAEPERITEKAMAIAENAHIAWIMKHKR